jgi:hypothetical protein
MAEDNKPQQRAAVIRATVARGRTIVIPDPTNKTITGHTPEGKPIWRSKLVEYSQGNEVELAPDEIVSLRARGFLLDPAQVIPPMAEGPHFTETGVKPIATQV